MDEPFECLRQEEGISRTKIMPDDVLNFYSEWDQKAASAMQHFNLVEQPLKYLINEKYKDKVMAVAAGIEPIDSSYDTLLAAIKEGATVNIDHFEEIEDLEKIASILDKTLTIGIRINLDAGIKPYWSRFGFNLESGQAMEAVHSITKSPTHPGN